MGFKIRISIISILILTIIHVSLSSAQTRESIEKNPKNFYVEIMKLNEKISFWSQKVEEFQNLSVKQDQLIKDLSLQLDRTKEELKLVKDGQVVTNEELKATKDELKLLRDEQAVSDKELNLTKHRLNVMKNELKYCACAYNSIIKPEVQHLRIVNDYYEETANFTWLIKDIKRLLNSSTKIRSPEFPLKLKNTKMIQFYFQFWSDDYVSLDVAYTDVKNIQPHFVIYATVRDGSGKGRDLVRFTSLSYVGEDYLPGFINPIDRNSPLYYYSHMASIRKTALRYPFYAINDAMTIDIHVEPFEVAEMTYSRDGRIVWAIDNYGQRKRLETEGSIECHRSPYFYTPGALKMQVFAFLNGKAKYNGTGLTMSVRVLNVLYNSRIQRTTVTLFNPVDLTRNVSRCVVVDVQQLLSYSMDMGEVEELLHEDTLYYEVVIEGMIGDETEVACARDGFVLEHSLTHLPDSAYVGEADD